MPGARGHAHPPHKIFGHLKIRPGALKHLAAKEKPMARTMNNGGTAARGRGRGRGQMQRLPGGNLPKTGQTPRPARGRGVSNGQRAGIGNAGMPGPGGAQLERRVQSGAITQEQAQKTMQQRQTLQKAFGKDWRTKVFGDRGYAQRTRKALNKNPDSARLAALNKKLMERRSTMLTAAQKKNSSGGGE